MDFCWYHKLQLKALAYHKLLEQAKDWLHYPKQQPVLKILSFCDSETLLKCKLASKAFYQIMQISWLWKRLVKQKIIFFPLPNSLIQAFEDSSCGFRWENVYFQLGYILKHRNDFTFTVAENHILMPLFGNWQELAQILFYSSLASPATRASAFNLEGTLKFKKEFARLTHTSEEDSHHGTSFWSS